MEITWEQAVVKKVEPFSLGIGIIRNVVIKKDAEGLDSIKEEVFEYIRNNFSIENIKDTPIVKAYRKFSWQYLNIDPTKIRPSGEALARRVLKAQKIPIINSIVYAINLASIKTQLSFSGFNFGVVKLPLIIRYPSMGEEFQGIGSRHRILTGNELLLADSEKILCIYAYGDGDVTKLTTKTRDILLVTYGLPNISDDVLKSGIELGLNYIQKAGGGEIEKVEVRKSVHPEP